MLGVASQFLNGGGELFFGLLFIAASQIYLAQVDVKRQFLRLFFYPPLNQFLSLFPLHGLSVAGIEHLVVELVLRMVV